MAEQLSTESETLLLAQARYILKNLHAERPGCGYDKLSEACLRASLTTASGEAATPSNSAGSESGEREKPSPWDLVTYQKLRAMPSSLNDATRTMDEAANEIDHLYAVLEELAVGFEAARDRCTYAAEAKRLDNCAKFCRSHTFRVNFTPAQPVAAIAQEPVTERWEVGKNGWDVTDEATREDI
jgi:hypothetical protein